MAEGEGRREREARTWKKTERGGEGEIGREREEGKAGRQKMRRRLRKRE